MKTFEILTSYLTMEKHEVFAEDKEEAKKIAEQGDLGNDTLVKRSTDMFQIDEIKEIENKKLPESYPLPF